MTRTALPEERMSADEAAEIVVLCRDMSGAPSYIGILDDEHHQPMYELDRDAARAIAYRLLHLSDYLPAPMRVLLRSSAVDERFREQE